MSLGVTVSVFPKDRCGEGSHFYLGDPKTQQSKGRKQLLLLVLQLRDLRPSSCSLFITWSLCGEDPSVTSPLQLNPSCLSRAH